jgi:hypothetical protein
MEHDPQIPSLQDLEFLVSKIGGVGGLGYLLRDSVGSIEFLMYRSASRYIGGILERSHQYDMKWGWSSGSEGLARYIKNCLRPTLSSADSVGSNSSM